MEMKMLPKEDLLVLHQKMIEKYETQILELFKSCIREEDYVYIVCFQYLLQEEHDTRGANVRVVELTKMLAKEVMNGGIEDVTWYMNYIPEILEKLANHENE